jgi:hypothetical protein
MWNRQCKPTQLASAPKYLDFLPHYTLEPFDPTTFAQPGENNAVSQDKHVEWVNRDQSVAHDPLHLPTSQSAVPPIDLGQDLGALCDSLRMANPYVPNEPEWFLWNEQAKLNVPILIHASLYLHDYCQKHGKRRILFTARDCCLWIQVFRQLFPEYDSIYFHSSRFTYRFASPSYVAYVQSLYTDDTLIVDVQGTGLTCENFFAKHFHRKPDYLAIVSSESHAILQQYSIFFEGIEMLNYDTCGTLYDVQEGKPLRCEPEYPLKYVAAMHKCLAKCLELLPRYSVRVFDQRVIEWAVKCMESDLAIGRYIVHAKCHCHLADAGGEIQHLHIARPKLLL